MKQSGLPPLGDPGLHFWITRSVARKMGLRFSEAMAAGHLDPQDYATMVTACRSCRNVAECMERLGRPGDFSVIPDYCKNADTLTALAARR